LVLTHFQIINLVISLEWRVARHTPLDDTIQLELIAFYCN